MLQRGASLASHTLRTTKGVAGETREDLVMEWYHTIEPFALPVHSYSGCCTSRLIKSKHSLACIVLT